MKCIFNMILHFLIKKAEFEANLKKMEYITEKKIPNNYVSYLMFQINQWFI